MPGLIYDHAYTAAADALRKTVAGANEQIDAAEWDLLHAVSVDRYPYVETASDPVRYCVTCACDWAPSVVIAFATELFNGKDLKFLLLDVKLAETDEDAAG